MLLKTIFLLRFVTIFNINSNAATISDQLCNVEINVKNIKNQIGNYLVLVNAKKQLLLDNVQLSPEGVLNLHLPKSVLFSHEGNYSIAVYSTDSGLSLAHLQDLYLTSEDSENCKNQVNDHIRHKRATPTGHSIGVQYSVWHGYVANAQRKIARAGGKPTSIERIIESNGSLHDYFSHGVNEDDTQGNYYMSESTHGFYCTYKKRETEAHGHTEDCPNIDKTFARHAEMLVASGVDYIYVDLTNFCNYIPEEDVFQRRPMELLFEEWHKLRTQEKATPQIVAWNRIDKPECVTWKDYLNLYNKYPDLVWRDYKTKKMVFMATDHHVDSLKHQIESNGGKNDVVVLNTWVADNLNQAKAGRWQFMSFCGGAADIAEKKSCDQFLWETALRENPQHITISGWNEYFAGAQKNPFGGYSHSVGMNPNDNRLFVDLYGAFRTRDIEPTLEYGDSNYKIMQSCIRVRNLNLHNNLTDCSVPTEVCCQIDNYRQFVNIHSMLKKDNTDYMLVNTPTERTALSATYKEICFYDHNTLSLSFCAGGLATDPNVALSGPFVIFNRSGANRQALYRCKNGVQHFISADVKCEGHTNDYLLGYTSTKKDSLFARSLNRCVNAAGYHYHALDGPCHPNDKWDLGDLGYVI